MRIRCRGLVALLLLLQSTAALAQITVNRTILDFEHDNQVQDFEVLNTGAFSVYLNLQVSEIRRPHQDRRQRVLLADPRRAEVLVSPSQITLPPGKSKRVRVIVRKQAKTRDRIYRLSVIPDTGPVRLTRQDPAAVAGGVKLLVGYDLLVISRPPEPQAKLDVKRAEDRLHLSNRGNSNVLMKQITQCSQRSRDCVELTPPKRLYAGEQLQLALNTELPGPWVIRTQEQQGDKVREVWY
ncbi:fimbria/pilus periplasmic chaperone [Granulosicoccaceae sp. 1_MG-2023]|nr:fimbria/pilus periplasmic chaperone [Granulosicoccaceae sp. 1_MG-2023]